MFSFYQKEPTERQKKIYNLREMAQLDEVALDLFHVIELECGMILRTPNSATESMVRTYNQLVRNSDLPLPERKQLLMEEKSK